ncbi:MAG: tRNA (adenosine(37)-N6)-threonylcarbamoyltransferase complex transferase subunit TsaD [Clostridiales bacterium]|jgi:N6-L-threonylcarbamoyladenine synthase|nr:tRNA (adenosine(37)-N6)-threonylcarbamoyltransferase complex transferase subunit TsaD [Clostridiales bacterium]
MMILGIETSCDETAASVIEIDDNQVDINNFKNVPKLKIISNLISTQIQTHQNFGGVIPEVASRLHIENIDNVIQIATEKVDINNIDCVAVSSNPGLIGALLVGVNYAKSLAYALNKPLISVNHIEAHICANFIEHSNIQFPFICLVVSGGHTNLIKVDSPRDYTVLATTRDDAAGEAFDKISRLLGLGYPGGPKIQEHAKQGNPYAYEFPKVSIPNSYDFSFSGVKTNIINALHKNPDMNKADIAASFQKAVVDVLAERTFNVANELNIKEIAIAGGVSANQLLRKTFTEAAKINECNLYVPSLNFCTDNAAMVAARGYFEYIKGNFADLSLNASSVKMR